MTDAMKIDALAEDARKTMTEQMEKMTRSFEDMTAFGQESMDAFMQSSSIAMKSAEEINAEVMSFSKKSVEEGVAAAKELAASKSMLEAMEKQADFAKASFDGFFKQAARMNELAMAASKDAMAPITARMTAAADMVKSYSA